MPKLIVDQSEFLDVVETLASADRYALDTEFHRERTYYPQVALVQIAWANTTVLIDPLAVDLGPLARVLDGPGLCIVHAGVQDLEVLDLACGTIPAQLFDTQIAAGFLGVASGSLTTLLDRFLDVHLTKGDRLTDWLRRPLTNDQLVYAAGDVDHLLELTSTLEAQLEAMSRLGWAQEESELLRGKPRNRRPPAEAVTRIKEARSLKGQALRVATAVATWREIRAATLDIPIRQVLPDIAVVAAAQQRPDSRAGLSKLRGLDGRHLKGSAAEEIVEAIKVGLAAPDAPTTHARIPDLPRELRPVVTLVTAWISQLARDHKLDPALLATRADVESLLREDPECRLLEGWRSDLVGAPIRHLVGGEAAVAFDGGGRLVLEQRSNKALL